MPLLAASPEPVPYVVVEVDRVGADVHAYGPAPAGHETVPPAAPAEMPVHKAHAADRPSAARHQRRAANTWDINARGVADEVARAAERVGARVVLVSGDVRARALLGEHLVEPWGSMLVDVDGGGRAAGGDHEREWTDVRMALERVRAQDYQVLAERFDRVRGQGSGGAVEGLEATVGALREGRVATLLLHDHPESSDRLWWGGTPATTAAGPGELVDGRAERADAVLPWFLSCTGAELAVLPGRDPRMTHGIGALLR